MTISGAVDNTSSNSDRLSDSFAAMIHAESPEGADGRLALTSARSSQVSDLAAGFAAVSPEFVSALGEGILEAIAHGEGVTDEMQRFEETADTR